MKLLVFGQTGQVAQELIRRAPAGVSITSLGRNQADLTQPKTCAEIIAHSDADAVINAAAYTAVDRAETEEDVAYLVNAAAPKAMAKAAAARGLPFVHISTDYVFSGTGDQPFHPSDPVAPLGAYGRTKRAGEVGVRDAGGAHVILRTSWVFSAHGANFVKTMLRLGAQRTTLSVVADQIGGPTPAASIADAAFSAVAGLLAGANGGTYHFAGAPCVSWADFARAIMAEAGLDCTVTDIPSSAYPTPAMRPLNSRLDCTSLTKDFAIFAPDWQSGLRDVIAQLQRPA
jgi:dTDP-4-dehydrorhamnose reductase